MAYLVKLLREFLNEFNEGFFKWNLTNKSIYFRSALIAGVFTCLYGVIILRIIELASTPDSDHLTLLKKESFVTQRREIVDRNGNLLAVNLSAASVYADGRKVIDAEDTVKKIASVFPTIEKSKLLKDIQAQKSFIWIKRNLTPKQQYSLHNLGLPGVSFVYEYKRVYPYKNLTSHVVGFVDRDDEGLGGVEQFFNKELKVSSDKIAKESAEALKLSLDIRVQNIVSQELDKTISKFNALGGTGTVIDLETGEVLALVSKPDFDPHFPGKASEEARFNKATLGTYEIGSVMKTLTMAIGLDTKAATMRDAYDISQPIRIAGFTIKDDHPIPGWHTLPEIFMYSSNIGCAQIMLEVGKQRYKSYLKTLNLMSKLPIELPEKSSPLYPSDSRWNDVSMVTMSYGYGLSISPMHFIQAMLPALNGGFMHNITLLKDKKKSDEPIVKVFNKETSYHLNQMLRLVVQSGTGKKAEVPGYLVGGKTGTAFKAKGGRYDKNARYSSFISVFPTINPKYVVYVMLDDPKGIKETFGFATAGWTAAPTVGSIISRIISLYGIKPYDMDSKEVQEFLDVEYKIDEQI